MPNGFCLHCFLKQSHIFMNWCWSVGPAIFLRKNGPGHSCVCWGTHELGTSIHPNKTIPSNLHESDLQWFTFQPPPVRKHKNKQKHGTRTKIPITIAIHWGPYVIFGHPDGILVITLNQPLPCCLSLSPLSPAVHFSCLQGVVSLQEVQAVLQLRSGKSQGGLDGLRADLSRVPWFWSAENHRFQRFHRFQSSWGILGKHILYNLYSCFGNTWNTVMAQVRNGNITRITQVIYHEIKWNKPIEITVEGHNCRSTRNGCEVSYKPWNIPSSY